MARGKGRVIGCDRAAQNPRPFIVQILTDGDWIKLFPTPQSFIKLELWG